MEEKLIILSNRADLPNDRFFMSKNHLNEGSFGLMNSLVGRNFIYS